MVKGEALLLDCTCMHACICMHEAGGTRFEGPGARFQGGLDNKPIYTFTIKISHSSIHYTSTNIYSHMFIFLSLSPTHHIVFSCNNSQNPSTREPSHVTWPSLSDRACCVDRRQPAWFGCGIIKINAHFQLNDHTHNS